jgi:hypothetical protein
MFLAPRFLASAAAAERCRWRAQASWAEHAASALGRPGGVPVVHHPLYSAPQLRPGHAFPMGVFQRIHDLLLADGVVLPAQVHTPPALLPRELLHLAHDAAYVDAFCAGALDEQCVRRIGFGEATQTRVLIERTQAEVAGEWWERALGVGLSNSSPRFPPHRRHPDGC